MLSFQAFCWYVFPEVDTTLLNQLKKRNLSESSSIFKAKKTGIFILKAENNFHIQLGIFYLHHWFYSYMECVFWSRVGSQAGSTCAKLKISWTYEIFKTKFPFILLNPFLPGDYNCSLYRMSSFLLATIFQLKRKVSAFIWLGN